MKHGNWTITENWKPHGRWEFVHDDYDGAPDSGDHRCGQAATVEDCIDEIKRIEGEATAE